jgi:hypothetical protein
LASCLRRIRLRLLELRSSGPLLANFLKSLAAHKRCGLSGQRFPAPNGNVDIDGVDFQGAGLAAGSLGGNQNCAAAAEGVEDKLAPSGAVPDCVGDKANRLDCRVHLQFVHSLGPNELTPA